MMGKLKLEIQSSRKLREIREKRQGEEWLGGGRKRQAAVSRTTALGRGHDAPGRHSQHRTVLQGHSPIHVALFGRGHVRVVPERAP